MIAQQTSCSLLQLPLVSVILAITLILAVVAAQYHFVLLVTADVQHVLSHQLFPARFVILLTIFRRQPLIRHIAFASLAFSSLGPPAIPAVQTSQTLVFPAFLPPFVSPASLTLLSLKVSAPVFRNTISTLLILAIYAKLDV